MLDNIYIKFADLYHTICKEMYSNKIKVVNGDRNFDVTTRSLFQSTKSIDSKYKDASDLIKREKFENYDDDILLSRYFEISHIWNIDVPFSEWILYVKQYIEFIRYVEKCYMYRNESSIDRESSDYALYCENEEDTLYIRDFTSDTKIRINFTESMINDITIDVTEENSILDYVNSGKSPKKQINVEFVDIILSREFGKQLVNQFRFIISENPKYNDESDKIMMESLQAIVGECIKMNFHDICDNYIRKFSRGDKNLKLKDVINGTVLFGY